ncbi:MAG: type II secretion system protein [Bacilli bacterium]|nr:type II secretion system protein [Bacilli bacterium]
MKKKGFTLVELLAVLVILSILSIIATVTVSSILNDSKSSLSDRQKRNIENAAETYYLKEGMNSNDMCISVEELIEKGYIDSVTVKDPQDRKEMTGYVKITYASNQYSYKYQEISCE